MLDLKESNVRKLIGKIDGGAWSRAIQTALVHVICHAMQYGGSPLASALAEKLEASAMLRKHKPAIFKYLTTHGPFNYSAATGVVLNKSKRDALAEGDEEAGIEPFDAEEFAENAPAWDDVKRTERKVRTLDLLQAVETLIKSAEKRQPDGTVAEVAMIPVLRAAIGKYVGDKLIATARAEAQRREEERQEQEKAAAAAGEIKAPTEGVTQ